MKQINADDLLLLAADPEFQRIVATDPELERLETLKYDEPAEFLLLMGIFNFRLAIGKLPAVCPLTPARWSLLWAIRNTYVTGGLATESDMDVFLYILTHDTRDLGCTPDKLAETATGYSRATGLSSKEVHAELREMIDSAFLPLRMLPKSGGQQEKPRYDAEWLTRITGCAARETNETATHCMFTMSLGAACCHYVNFLRRESSDGFIARCPPKEAVALQIRRLRELQVEYLKKIHGEKNADGM